MSDTIELAVDTRELEAALAKLSTKMQTKVMTEALQAGGDVIAKELESYTPERTDEEVPAGDWHGFSGSGTTSLPPGIMKADIKTEIQLGSSNKPPRIKVGFGEISAHVAYWQNEGWNLTKGGYRHKDKHGRARGAGKVIKAIPGKHFIEMAFDDSCDGAVGEFLDVLGQRLIDDPAAEGGS